MPTKYFLVLALLGLLVGLSYQENFANQTLNFDNQQGPNNDTFTNCTILLTNSSFTESWFISSVLKSYDSVENNNLFYEGRVTKNGGSTNGTYYFKIIYQVSKSKITSTAFIGGFNVIDRSELKGLFLNNTFTSIQSSNIEKALVNHTIFTPYQSNISNSLFNYSSFILFEGTITDSEFNFTKVTLKDVTLKNVEFYNCVLCIDPSVKMSSVSFVNTSFNDPKVCDANNNLQGQLSIKGQAIGKLENEDDTFDNFEDFLEEVGDILNGMNEDGEGEESLEEEIDKYY